MWRQLWPNLTGFVSLKITESPLAGVAKRTPVLIVYKLRYYNRYSAPILTTKTYLICPTTNNNKNYTSLLLKKFDKNDTNKDTLLNGGKKLNCTILAIRH